MLDLIRSAAPKLEDPILMDWAIHHYKDAREAALSERCATMEALWFNDRLLRYWIEADDTEILTSLVHNLPAERFANLVTLLAERWSDWEGALAKQAAPILAQYQPARAIDLFSEFLGGDPADDPRKLAGVIEGLAALPPDDGRCLLDKAEGIFWDLATGSLDRLTESMYLSALLKATLSLRPDRIAHLLSRLIARADARNNLNPRLNILSRVLFGSDAFYTLALQRQDEDSAQDFQDLAPLFRTGSPLTEIDRILLSEDALPEMLALLGSAPGALPPQIREAIETSGAEDDPENEIPLNALAVAALAHAYAAESIDPSAMELDEAMRLLASDLSELPHFDALAERVRAFEPEAVTDAMERFLETARYHNGVQHLMRLAGVLGEAVYVPMLIEFMDEDSADECAEAAQNALIRIGATARDELIDSWAELDASQRIYGLTVIGIVDGDPTVDFLLETFPTLFQEETENWCYTASSAPDPRLVERLAPELRQKDPLVDQAFYTLCRLLDLDHEALDEIRERVLQHRREVREHMADFAKGLFHRETVTLALRCPRCDEINHYKARSIVVGIDPDSPPLIAEEFPCASCGEYPDFEFTPKARQAVKAHLMLLAVEAFSGKSLGGESPVRLVKTELRGKNASLPELIAYHRDLIRREPDSITSRLALADVYFTTLNRPRQALEHLEPIREKAPHAVECALLEAKIQVRLEQSRKAFQILERALAEQSRWIVFRHPKQRAGEVAGEFAGLYNQLHIELGIKDRPMLNAADLLSSLSPRKVGRNDPCPCGSGKKYKKCCMNK